MQGMGMKSLMKNPALIPLYVFTGIGAAGALYYTLRLDTRSPEITWNRKSNPELWKAYRAAQHKFYSPIRNYSKTESPASKY